MLLSAVGVFLVASGTTIGAPLAQVPNPPPCQSPVDISLVFDHSGSMSQNSKLSNARTAVEGFISTIDNDDDDDLSPHEVALTGLADGSAQTDVPLTTDASILKSTVLGYQASGFTNIGRGIQLGQLQLSGQTDPDTMVILSDGSSNTPMDVDEAGSQNDFYIDVNDNGVLDFFDGINVDFPDPESDPGTDTADFQVLNGLWLIDDSADLLNQLDVNGDGILDTADDYNFGPGYNFSIINGALYLDADGDGSFAENLLEPPEFTMGHDDELAIIRTGRAWGGLSDFSRRWLRRVLRILGDPEQECRNDSLRSRL